MPLHKRFASQFMKEVVKTCEVPIEGVKGVTSLKVTHTAHARHTTPQPVDFNEFIKENMEAGNLKSISQKDDDIMVEIRTGADESKSYTFSVRAEVDYALREKGHYSSKCSEATQKLIDDINKQNQRVLQYSDAVDISGLQDKSESVKIIDRVKNAVTPASSKGPLIPTNYETDYYHPERGLGE